MILGTPELSPTQLQFWSTLEREIFDFTAREEEMEPPGSCFRGVK